MPACNLIKLDAHSAYLIWRIDTKEQLVLNETDKLTQSDSARIAHPQKYREWLAARLALRQLLATLGYEYMVLCKDVWGRPYLSHSHLYISISHCTAFAVAAVDQQGAIGVDIQWPYEKLLSVKDKFLGKRELANSGNERKKLCVYWAAKEAIYKAMGGRGISLKEDIYIHNFIQEEQGVIQGEVGSQLFVVHYSFFHDHVLAWCKAKDR